MKKAYLDIETTGLSWDNSYITVIGILVCDGEEETKIQLYGDMITDTALDEAFCGVEEIFTFNGARFDLPFIKRTVGIDLLKGRKHHDLMYSCKKYGLYGGLKRIEKELGIGRDIEGCNGYMAVKLWWQYVNNDDEEALDVLLRYNMDDVRNLKVLEERLKERRQDNSVASV